MAYEPIGRRGYYTGETVNVGPDRYTWIPTRDRWELSGGTTYNNNLNTSPNQAYQNAIASGLSQQSAQDIRAEQVNRLTNPGQNYLFGQSIVTGLGVTTTDTQSSANIERTYQQLSTQGGLPQLALDYLTQHLDVVVRINKSSNRGKVFVKRIEDDFITRKYNSREFEVGGIEYYIEESGKKSSDSYKLVAIQKVRVVNTSDVTGYKNQTYWCVEKQIYKDGRFITKETYEKDGDIITLDFDLSKWDIKITPPPPPIETEEYEYETVKTEVIREARGASIFLNAPSINVEPKSTTYTLNSSGLILSWNSNNTNVVNFTLGNIQRKLKPSGTLKLTKSDFPNGVGQYTAILQPVGDGGSGEPGKVVINVQQDNYISGPDITHVTYPQNITGADFQGYDIDFKINWSSVSTNWVDVYVSKVSTQTKLASKKSPQGSLVLNVKEVLQKAGDSLSEDIDTLQFKLLLIPYNDEGNSTTSGKTEEVLINFDKSNVKLKRGNVVRDIRESISSLFKKSVLENETSKYLTHLLHFGDADNKIISTWGIDTETFSEYKVVDTSTGREEKVKEVKTLVLKLYEPLPKSIQPNQQVWLSKIQSIPIIEQFTIVDESVEDCIVLQPNLNEEFQDNVGLQIFDDIIASGSNTSTDLVNQFISGSGFNLDVLDIKFISASTEVSESVIVPNGEYDYYWSNFVKYSSAQERVENFYYKMKTLEFYNHRLRITSASIEATTGSITATNEYKKIETQISNLTNGFDAFEKWLYVSSSEDGYTYPKQDNTGSFLNPTGSDGISWYNNAIYSAELYDRGNINRLVNNLPIHVQDSNEGQEFVLFFDMIGQHFDILYLYTKAISDSKKTEHKYEYGIKDSLIYQMLESLGWDADIGVKSQALWEYAFGKFSDGTTSSVESGKKRQNEVWRRILNNLPYLLKHKGTKRALHALMSCYGIPTSLLTVMEFGGPQDVTTDGTTNFTYDDRTASINISGSAAITIPWKTFDGDYPNSVEIRINTEVKQDHQIISGSDWSLDILKDNGSLAKIQLTVGDVSSSTDAFPFFNDVYTQIVVNRVTGSSSDSFEFFAKEGFQERIRNEVSASLTAYNKGWTSGSLITIGGNTLNASIDEFRLWRVPLNEVNIDNHTLLPDAIDGTSPSASTEDLILRHDFEYPKNRATSVEIKNVALTTVYTDTGSIASGFENTPSYPYQYTPYDRTVTAKIPSSGIALGNKFRFESQYNLDGSEISDGDIDLSYKSRATQKSFDKSPIDTDRLGLFFSPIKEINMDILKSVGPLNIDDYIGNPADNYNYTYSTLDTFREYYFSRFNLNFNEYVQLVRYIDKTLFKQLESLVPARAKVASGLLFEPHILERSKVQWTKPQGSHDTHLANIDIIDNVSASSDNIGITTVINASDDTILNGELPFYVGIYSSSDDTTLIGELPQYEGEYQLHDETQQSGEIRRNEEATMGGFEFFIDAKITGSAMGSYIVNEGYQIVPPEGPFDVSVAGFGLYGENGYSIRTRFDGNGNIVKDRIKVYLVKESYTEMVPTISGSVGGNYYRLSVPVDEEITKYKYKVNILPFSGSDGNESKLAFTGSLDYVSHESLDGYFPTHYRNVGDLTTGLENSFFNGAKQTRETTLDGGLPVQTFTTNPNTLRVSDTGRGSGEPILEVD